MYNIVEASRRLKYFVQSVDREASPKNYLFGDFFVLVRANITMWLKGSFSDEQM